MTNPWFVCATPRPQARLRLFCFPYAGGGAAIFRAWPNDLPASVEVWAILPPGRETRLRETPFTQISSLAQTLGQIILPYLNLPFVFFGHSMGARTSFELARQFRTQGSPQPLHLFVSGDHAPQLPDSNPPIHHLPKPDFIKELRRFNGTPDAVLQHPELMELLLPLLRADLTAIETYAYTPQAPLDCPISAFGGLEDKEVSQEELAAWREQTCRSFTLRMFPGDHFFLHTARTSLLQAISQDLKQLLARLDGWQYGDGP